MHMDDFHIVTPGHYRIRLDWGDTPHTERDVTVREVNEALDEDARRRLETELVEAATQDGRIKGAFRLAFKIHQAAAAYLASAKAELRVAGVPVQDATERYLDIERTVRDMLALVDDCEDLLAREAEA